MQLKAELNGLAKRKGVEWTRLAGIPLYLEKQAIIWKSSNPKTASVSGNGKVAAKKNGKAVITARVRGTKAKAECRITVGTPVSKIALNRKKVSLKTGQKFMLKATVSPKKASIKKVVYESSNNKAATVNQKGEICAVSVGRATIRATAADGSGKKASCTVTVEPAAPVQPEEPEQPEIPEQPEEPETGKILVAYFSWSGTSERIAKNIIEQTGADAFRIEREIPYSDNYSEVATGDAKDEADNNARPPIKNPPSSVEQYGKIVLCYPIWWHTAPMTVGTFLEGYDFSGKSIYPVSQSASMDTSQYAQSVAFIKECTKGAAVDDGIFTRDDEAIRSYIRTKLGLPDYTARQK